MFIHNAVAPIRPSGLSSVAKSLVVVERRHGKENAPGKAGNESGKYSGTTVEGRVLVGYKVP
jgi:hypothetical protein